MDCRKGILKHHVRNPICVEIGVWDGCFSQQILNEMEPKRLFLIDPWEYMPVYTDRYYGGLIAKNQEDMDTVFRSVINRFNLCSNVTIIRKMSHNAVNMFEDEYIDWVYIDGNHSYAFVLNDLNMFVTKVKTGGCLVGDDYNYWEVKKAVNKFISSNVLVRQVPIKDSRHFVLEKVR